MQVGDGGTLAGYSFLIFGLKGKRMNEICEYILEDDFGIFIDSGPLGEKQIDEQNGFILVVAVLFLQTDPQTAPRQHRRSLDTLQTPSRHPQDTLQTPSIANRRIKTSFYTLNLFQLLLGGGLN